MDIDEARRRHLVEKPKPKPDPSPPPNLPENKLELRDGKTVIFNGDIKFVIDTEVDPPRMQFYDTNTGKTVGCRIPQALIALTEEFVTEFATSPTTRVPPALMRWLNTRRESYATLPDRKKIEEDPDFIFDDVESPAAPGTFDAIGEPFGVNRVSLRPKRLAYLGQFIDRMNGVGWIKTNVYLDTEKEIGALQIKWPDGFSVVRLDSAYSKDLVDFSFTQTMAESVKQIIRTTVIRRVKRGR